MSYYYPSTLPRPTVEGNSMASGPTFTKKEFDSGFRHRRSVDTPMMLEFAFLVTRSQMLTFFNFYQELTDGGADNFSADWEVSGFAGLKTFRFSKPPAAVALGYGLYSIQSGFEMITKIQDLATLENILGDIEITYEMDEVVIIDGTNTVENAEG